MPATTPSAAHYVRQALLKIDPATILELVDSLDLRGNAKVSAVVGMPLRGLQQRRDVVAFAAGAPLPAVKGLLELLAMGPLEKVIEALGEHADTPTFDQLSVAVDQLLASGTTDDEIVAVLCFAIGEEFPAASHCRLLLERPAFVLPELVEPAPSSSLLVPKEIDPQVREQRRARREQEKLKKKATGPVRPPRPAKVKVEQRPAPPVVASPVAPATVVERRQVMLTPAELEQFSAAHPLVGTVVLAEVPFDAVDPLVPDQKAKPRPAVVVAATDEALLVRPVYSNSSTTRVLFQPWRRLGLDHVSYVDGHRVALTISSVDDVVKLGRLTDVEWNALF